MYRIKKNFFFINDKSESNQSWRKPIIAIKSVPKSYLLWDLRYLIWGILSGLGTFKQKRGHIFFRVYFYILFSKELVLILKFKTHLYVLFLYSRGFKPPSTRLYTTACILLWHITSLLVSGDRNFFQIQNNYKIIYLHL